MEPEPTTEHKPTRQQRAVLDLLAQGAANKDIANAIDCRLSDVEQILSRLYAYQYDTPGRRRGTAAHEAGHAFSLAHETQSCGDGTKPRIIMSYQCMETTSLGGWALNAVQPWDSCGVNHAYHDPNWGYSGC